MKKILLFSFAVFLLMSFSVIADDKVRIIPETSSISAYSGDTVTLSIIIENRQSSEDRFSLVVPSYQYKVRASPEEYSPTIPANSNKTIKISFSIPLDADELTLAYPISVSSITTTASDTQTILLTIIRKSPVYISDIKLDNYLVNPEQEFRVDTTLTNLETSPSAEYSLETVIRTGDQIVKRFDTNVLNVPQKSTQTFSNSFGFDKYAAPGVYTVESTLKDSLNRKVNSQKTNVKLAEIKNVVHTKSTKSGLLSQTISIRVKNEGNVKSDSLFVVETTTENIKNFFYPATAPTVEESGDGTIVYKWLINPLQPGEEVVIQYEVRTLNLWIVLMVIGVSIIVAFKYVFAFQIVKRHRHRGPITKDSEIVISLDVRNRTRHEMKDVVVKDFVPSIVKVVERFDTVRPKVKAVAGGTELYWKFDSLGAGEERVLTYRVKPAMEIIGGLKLPKAHAKFIDKKKEKKVVTSKHVVIKPS